MAGEDGRHERRRTKTRCSRGRSFAEEQYAAAEREQAREAERLAQPTPDEAAAFVSEAEIEEIEDGCDRETTTSQSWSIGHSPRRYGASRGAWAPAA